MEHNIHREQTLLSPTASTLLPSPKNAPSTSVAQQVSKSASSGLGDHLAPPGLVSGSQELTVLKPVHNRAQESAVSSEYDTAPESTFGIASTLLKDAPYATSPIARDNHLLEGEVGIRSNLDLNQAASHQENITSTRSTTGANAFKGHTIQQDPRSRSQPSLIGLTRRKASSHHGCSASPAFSRAINTSEDHSLQENASPRSQPPSIYATVLFRQEELASTPSSRGLSIVESRSIRGHILSPSNSKAPSHRENAFAITANLFEAHSLRKPVLRSPPPSSDPSIIVRDFFHEPVVSPLYERQLFLSNNEDQEPKAVFPPEAVLRQPSLRSLTSYSSLRIAQKLRTYRSNSLSSTSSTSTNRLPRYLGNHSSAVSQLGRSISLELPPLREHFVPRRAHSLPRIAEYCRPHPHPDPGTLYISSRVGDFHLPYPHSHLNVRRCLDSSGRTPKVAEYTPAEMSNHRRHLAASSVMGQQASEDVVEWLELPPGNGNGTRVWGQVKSGRHGMMWRGKVEGGQYWSSNPTYLWEEPGRWGQLKKKVKGFFGRVVGRQDD
ncbi:hypothetical protein MMC30_005482 [Trapelia coarctata]|nr:hypothetical protein [Trapelia coarctata]